MDPMISATQPTASHAGLLTKRHVTFLSIKAKVFAFVGPVSHG